METASRINYLDIHTTTLPEKDGEQLIVDLPNGLYVKVSREKDFKDFAWHVDFDFKNGDSECLYFYDRQSVEYAITAAGIVASRIGEKDLQTFDEEA